jgi:hypothetical protein
MGDCQRKAGQPGTRPEVGPALSWRRCSNPRQPEGVVQVPFPEPFPLSWAQEPELDRLGVGVLQELRLFGCQGRAPWRGVAVGPMFHVKRYVGWMITRRLGSSPRLSVVTPSIAATASCTILRSAGVIGWNS